MLSWAYIGLAGSFGSLLVGWLASHLFNLYYKTYVYVYGRRNGSKNSMENLRGRGMYLGAPRSDVHGLCSIGISWQQITSVVFSLTMAPWLVLLLPWPVLASEPVDRGDSMIMKAIMSQIVISLQRDYKEATEMRNTDKTRVKEVPNKESPPLQVFLDNWIRIIRKRQMI